MRQFHNVVVEIVGTAPVCRMRRFGPAGHPYHRAFTAGPIIAPIIPVASEKHDIDESGHPGPVRDTVGTGAEEVLDIQGVTA
jgi:hypothetical protein